jgi:NAD(P)-dependent dehydrogenase (short-subunit alcohol dehydrogenase family)
MRGIYEFGSFGEITEAHFDKTFNTNVHGLLFTAQKALPLLTERASVIPHRFDCLDKRLPVFIAAGW